MRKNFILLSILSLMLVMMCTSTSETTLTTNSDINIDTNTTNTDTEKPVVHDEDKAGFMVYGNDFIITYSLPQYWQVDMNFAARNNIDAFFYIDDLGIGGSPVGIIMTLASKPDDGTDLDSYIDYDYNY